MKTLEFTSLISWQPLQNASRLLKKVVITFAQSFCLAFTVLVICLCLDDGFIQLVAQGIPRNQLGEGVRSILHIVTFIATFLTAFVVMLTAGNWTGYSIKGRE